MYREARAATVRGGCKQQLDPYAAVAANSNVAEALAISSNNSNSIKEWQQLLWLQQWEQAAAGAFLAAGPGPFPLKVLTFTHTAWIPLHRTSLPSRCLQDSAHECMQFPIDLYVLLTQAQEEYERRLQEEIEQKQQKLNEIQQLVRGRRLTAIAAAVSIIIHCHEPDMTQT